MNVEPSMSELEPQAPSAPAEQRHGGVLLRERRIASGMHIVGLSAVLKVPVARLEALEAGRFDELPDLIFARALASSVCRVLKTDAAPVLAALPMPAAPAPVAPAATIDMPKPMRPQGGPPLGGHAARRQRRFWVMGLLLVVLALLASGAWWWQQPSHLLVQADAEPLTPLAQPAAEPAPAAPVQDVALQAPMQTPIPAPTTDTATVTATVASSPQPLPAQAQPAAVAPSAAAPVAAPAVVTPVVSISASQVTWVQVLGASGALRLERTLQAGESIEASDDLPLQVVVGRADAVEVKVRGQRFDLAPYTRNQVSRFQVR